MIGGHPLALPPVSHTGPVPRRIRAVLDGHIVADTSALYVWEWSDYPQYYIPVENAPGPGPGAFSLGSELRPLPGVADHDATIPAYEFDNPFRG